MRHLFIDDYEIAHMRGLKRTLHPGTLYEGNPVIHNDYPWERYIIKSGGTYLLHDPTDGLYKLYYLVIPRLVTSKVVHINGKRLPPHTTQVCYATSTDMIHWEKPMLGQCTFDDEPDSNLLAIGDENPEGQGILYDPHDPDPSRRYKALFWDHRVEPRADTPPGGRAVIRRVGEGARHAYDVIVEDADGNAIWKRTQAKGDVGGMWAAFSPDGVQWTPYEDNPVSACGNDTTTSVHYDEYLKRYVAFGRFNGTAMGHGQAFGVVARHGVRRRRTGRACPDGGDLSGMHQRRWFAGFRVEHQDAALMGLAAPVGIAGKDADQLGPEGIRGSHGAGHHTEHPAVGHAQDRAQGLDALSARQSDHAFMHQRDRFLIGEVFAHEILSDHSHWVAPGKVTGSAKGWMPRARWISAGR